MKKRVTLRDIAVLCGCTPMTVSLVLRRRGRVSEALRVKIAAAARKLDYRPDPALSALAAYRRSRRTVDSAAPLAWVSNMMTERWTPPTYYIRSYFEGARARAAEIGYRLEPFWLRAPGMTGGRLSRILYARGIQGLLLPPQPVPRGHLNLAWEKFSVVTFGYSLARPALHMVSTHHFRSMTMQLRKLRSLGYRRIGLSLGSAHDARIDHNYYGAYLIEAQRFREEEKVPPFFYEEPFSAAAFIRWVRQHRPEVVMVDKGGAVMEALRKGGFSVPDGLGVVNLHLGIGEEAMSGADENLPEVGAAAVDFVVSLIQNNERGIPENPRSVLINSRWVEGTTLRRVNR